ncbi:hypothetical protein FSPOR_5998 [Fusarium sporotrichioides]|uniref:LYR motif-containing protein Cup1-like N-terminal domain-containing protein n=1 Tax=Fusarium sporotrichioides TaxID=5514 RepID=A0A395S4Y8_FUSSP|nr:hypothetical protein FSPOR_5998 [Fusarium sporotrichioides]
MPFPNSNIPNFLPPRHLYRHILRETSYLPPAIRPTITTQIRSKFRGHRRNDPLRDKHRAKGTNVLRKLRAANSGHKKWMEELLMHAFGRKGSRRRSLMSSFVRPEPPSDTEALEEMIKDAQADQKPDDGVVAKSAETTIEDDSSPGEQKAKKEKAGSAIDTPSDGKEEVPRKILVRRGPKPLEPTFYHKWDVPKLAKLLSSQRSLQQSVNMSWPKSSIRGLDPDMDTPKTNIWGKPTPERVYQAKRAHFWRRSIPKAMPPLDNSEWEFLGRLSNGAQEEEQWKIPERRTAAKPVRLVKTRNKSPTLDWDWESYATQPTNKVERINPLAQFAHVGPDKTDHPYHHHSDRDLKELTPRWFRRAYQRIWHLSPKMETRPTTGKNIFVWGTFNPGVTAPSRRQLEIFDGVDSKGQVPRTRQPKIPKTKPDIES